MTRSRMHGKRERQEGAIERLENTLKMHEANTELTVAIMKGKIADFKSLRI